MADLIFAVLNGVGALLKVLFFPAMIAMMVTIPAQPLMRLLNVPEPARERVAKFARWISIGATVLVLLGFVLLFGGLMMAGEAYRREMNPQIDP